MVTDFLENIDGHSEKISLQMKQLRELITKYILRNYSDFEYMTFITKNLEKSSSS